MYLQTRSPLMAPLEDEKHGQLAIDTVATDETSDLYIDETLQGPQLIWHSLVPPWL